MGHDELIHDATHDLGREVDGGVGEVGELDAALEHGQPGVVAFQLYQGASVTLFLCCFFQSVRRARLVPTEPFEDLWHLFQGSYIRYARAGPQSKERVGAGAVGAAGDGDLLVFEKDVIGGKGLGDREDGIEVETRVGLAGAVGLAFGGHARREEVELVGPTQLLDAEGGFAPVGQGVPEDDGLALQVFQQHILLSSQVAMLEPSVGLLLACVLLVLLFILWGF